MGKKVFLKYHWVRFYLQWLRLYTLHVYNGFKEIMLNSRFNIELSPEEVQALIIWIPWETYKVNGSYYYGVKIGFATKKSTLKIDGNRLNELLGTFYDLGCDFATFHTDVNQNVNSIERFNFNN